jgi:gluconolactonase
VRTEQHTLEMAVATAARLPGPPELLPGLPDAIVDLQSTAGTALVEGQWRYSDAEVREIEFVEVADHLGPGTVPNRTSDVVPHAEAAGYDDSQWTVLSPEDTQRRLSTGRVCFNWYRIAVTIPTAVGALDPTGCTVIFEVAIDDYAEVWVDGELPHVIGQTGGTVVGGFNAPSRVILTRDARPGQRFQLAVFGINGPISTSPRNYIWMRTATLDFYSAERAAAGWEVPYALDVADEAVHHVVPREARLERLAGGFEFTEGPVWATDGGLLFSSPNTNAIYRWTPEGKVDLFRAKSGYTGVDVGRYTQPGSNGLTFDPQGRLTMCQHGNRRIVRVEPHGNITVMADRYMGDRLNSPNDLVYRSDGTLYFTDPPFGLPEMFDDPDKELLISGVFRLPVGGSELSLEVDDLHGPNGLAFSPDERYMYVGDWDVEHKAVMRYEVDQSGALSNGTVLHDMTDASPEEVAIDGLKVDRAGTIFVCGPGGIWILSAAGEHLGTLRIPEEPHNLAWGDEDGCALYVTAITSIYRIRLVTPGIRPQ